MAYETIIHSIFISHIKYIFLGCNLSPLLFSIFIRDLGEELKGSGLGIEIPGLKVASIFFADDIALIGRSSSELKVLMNICRRYFDRHKLELSETKSKIISHEAQPGEATFTDYGQDLTLEQVVSFKYLGIPVSTAPYCLYNEFNASVQRKAKSYMYSVMSLVKTGPDRSDLAHTLWTSCALPAILYGAEVMPLSKGTLKEVERCQNKVGKFILGIPQSSANITVNIDAGLRPVWSVVAERVLGYASKLMKNPACSWTRVAMSSNISDGYRSPYTKYLMHWQTRCGSSLLSPKLIKKTVTRTAIIATLNEHRKFSSLVALNPPSYVGGQKWFSPKPWITDSIYSKIFSMFRCMNAGLGNRGPCKDGNFYKLCPLCSKQNEVAVNNEVM